MKNNNKTTVIGLLAVLIILALGYAVGVRPAIDSAMENRDSLAAQQEQNDSTRVKLADLKKKEADLPRVKAEAASLAAQFPGTAEQVAVITALNNAAAASGATLVAVKPNSPALGATVAEGSDANKAATAASQPVTPGAQAAGADFPVGTVNMTIIVRGSSEQVRNFVAGAEKMQFPLIVGNITVTGAAENDVVESVITGSMYLTRTLEEPQAAVAG